MWNFRNFTIGFFILLLVFNLTALFSCPCENRILQFFCLNQAVFYTTLVSLYLAIPVVLSFFPCLEFHHKPVICRGNTDENIVTLTFDDGPDPANTPLILEILKRHGIIATFFIIGKKIAGNEKLVKEIVQQGHLIGNHSFSHSVMWDFQPGKKIREDIEMTNALILGVTGTQPLFFRPPYGVINPMVHSGLRDNKLPVVAWSKRSFDTLIKDESRIIEKMTKSISPGDILLFHDTSELTPRILGKIILSIQSKGFRFTSLDQFIKTNPHA